MDGLTDAVDELATETRFTGVVRVDNGDELVLAAAYGLADRAHGIANAVATRFGIASGVKGFTALTVMRLVEQGALALEATARSLLGADLPLIDDRVTVEHLLGHRSGIGDFLDEVLDTDINEYVLAVGVHELVTTEDYLEMLDGYPAKFAPDERFSYCNGGYVVLALLAERAAGRPFHDLVDELVCQPAGMSDSEFLRSDELPGGVALGYLSTDGLRTNVLHLPVRGSGDGGIYSTAADLRAFWAALFEGRIVALDSVAAMVRPRSDAPENSSRYGLGFWLRESTDVVFLEGCDAGVSFRSAHDPGRAITHTVLSNTSDGAWPMTRRLAELLAT